MVSQYLSTDLTINSFNIFSKIKRILPLNSPRINKNYLVGFIDSHIIHYPTPISFTYAWSFGSLAGICLVIQMISGIFLAMHYTPNIELAFNSVEYIMRDVPNGWLVRYIHANGASMFFIVVYSHICRGLYYGSYIEPREHLWCSGVTILLLMMGTAFTGYVLPWGQMSFWGATVITNMVTAIPIAGQPIVQWLWGGYTVGNPTLNRFFSIHFFLPFLIAGFSLIHLALLHKEGSNNPIGSDTGVDDVPFYPYFFAKDVFAFSCFLLFFTFFVLYFPNVLNHPDNYIPADPLQTPAHVVPEWYFLPFYAILRSIPHKAGGIVAMGAAILILLTIPFTNTSYIRNTTYRPIFKIFFWLFIADYTILTWIGQMPVRNTYIFVGQVATFYYFFFFIFLIPITGKIETILATQRVTSVKKPFKELFSTYYNKTIFNKSNNYIRKISMLCFFFVFIYILINFLGIEKYYLNVIEFIIRRFIILIVLLIILQNVITLPIVKELEEEMKIFNEGPQDKSLFFTYLREYHYLIIVLIYFCYILATTYFVNNIVISYVLGLISFTCFILYLMHFFVYTKTYIFRSVKPQKISIKTNQIRTIYSGRLLSYGNVKKSLIVCLECTKVGITLIGGAEISYKLTHGGLNDISPWRQAILNQTFPEDRTKIWTESKAGIALHNRAMGYPHDRIYTLINDTFSNVGPKKSG